MYKTFLALQKTGKENSTRLCDHRHTYTKAVRNDKKQKKSDAQGEA